MSRFTALVSVLAIVLVSAACGSSSQLVADAGADRSLAVGESPSFDACRSEGEITNYQWLIVEAPPGNEEDHNKMIRVTEPSCSFTLDADMQIDEIGTWVIELTVTGEDNNSDSDTVTVTVTS